MKRVGSWFVSRREWWHGHCGNYFLP